MIAACSCFWVASAGCREEYERCVVEAGPAGAGSSERACACADEFYGVCARKAGFAADLMTECIDTLTKGKCSDASVCGAHCASDDELTRVVPVNNDSPYFLKFDICKLKENKRSLDNYGLILMNRCDQDSFFQCPYWIPPHTFTALTLSKNASYLRMHSCLQDYTCLPHPTDFYGTHNSFPPSIDLDAENKFTCDTDMHCPGSFCDHLKQPPTCAKKTTKQLLGPLADFNTPNWLGD